ncbi:MAG TPA: histidine kinase [Flavisolibacter sp.]
MNITATYNRKWIRILAHIAFVAVCYTILLRMFAINNQPALVDHVYTGLFLATILPVVYFNLEFLIPRLGSQQTWLQYLVALLGAVALFVWLNVQLFEKWSAKLLPDFFFIAYYRWWDVLLFFIVFLAVTTLVKLSKSWFTVNEMQQRLLVMEKEKTGMELAALKAQVNPHFFFNTLNSIYSLSLHHDERLPAAILGLSDIMRYYLYESREDHVPLQKELQILRDYIELQRIRSGNQLDLRFNLAGEVTTQRIPPLMLVTFAENAFKHGAKGEAGATFIHMDLAVHGNDFSLRIANNKGQALQDPQGSKGVGLENVRRRLELLYPGRHRLNVSEDNDTFTIELHMTL